MKYFECQWVRCGLGSTREAQTLKHSLFNRLSEEVVQDRLGLLKVETSLDYLLFKEVVLPAQESPVLALTAILAAVCTCTITFLSDYGDKYQNGLYAISGLILVSTFRRLRRSSTTSSGTRKGKLILK